MISNRKGMAYYYVVFIGLIILNLIVVVHMFQGQQAFVVDLESESYITYLVAEGGINTVIQEMNANFEWLTHRKAVQNDFTYDFTEPVPSSEITKYVKGSDRLKVNVDGNKYCSEMKIIDSFDSEFKVKVGRVEAKDNPKTSNLDESEIFLAIKSVAKYNDVYKAIDAIVEIAYANRFVLYDGKYLLLAYGVSTGMDEETIIADGEIYAKHHVLAGTTIGGPRLVLKNNPVISTGSEGYISIPPQDKNNIRIENDLFGYNSQVGEEYSKITTKIKEVNSSQPGLTKEKIEEIQIGENNFSELFKDKYTGGRDFDIDYSGVKNYYRSLAKGELAGQGVGIYIEKTSSQIVKVKYPNYKYNPDIEVVMLDFGEMIMGNISNSDDFGDNADFKIPGTPPVNFNGVLYSELPLVIWGNPDRDMIIYSEGDIFIAGDFNQRQKPGTEMVGGSYPAPVLQNYTDKNAMTYEKQSDYVNDNETWRTSNPEQGAYWNNVDIVSEQRIWIDYTDPRKFAKNELIPFIHYEIYKELFMPVDSTGKIIELNTLENELLEKAWDFSVNLSNNKKDLNEIDNPGLYSDGSPSFIQFCFNQPTIDKNFVIDLLNDELSVGKGLMNYLKNILFMVEADAEAVIEEIAEMIVAKDVPHVEIRDIIELDLWGENSENIDLKAFLLCEPPALATDYPTDFIGMVQRLYNLTNYKDGKFSELGNVNYKSDELFIPEMTINAKKIAMGDLVPNYYSGGTAVIPNNFANTTQRWDVRVDEIEKISSSADFDKLNTIKEVNAIREEIGNRNLKIEGGGSFTMQEQVDSGYFRYIATDRMFQRSYGSEVYLRNMTDLSRLDYLGGGYAPHIRKKVFDKNNRTKFEIRSFNIIDLNYYTITEDEYKAF